MLLLASLLGSACTAGGPSYEVTGTDPTGKTDTGWVGDTSFEVGATFRSSVTTAATGRYADLATDNAQQFALIDAQLKFGKNPMEAQGYELNQLFDSVTSFQVTVDDTVTPALVTIDYEASIDLIRALSNGRREVPTRDFTISVPRDPIGTWSEHGQSCVNDSEAAEYSFYYYFDSSKQGCMIPLATASLAISEVYERTTVYPEYDQLLNDLGDGTRGFRAALVPNTGDSDPLSRFNDHKAMLENDLGLTGTRAENDLYVRYEWLRNGTKMIIDLYDPTKASTHSESFRAALSAYQLIHYNGHSEYGTRDLLTHPEAYTRDYQIIVMHACRTYPYYVRQVFRSKATEEDMTGFAAADVVGAGESTYPYASPITMKALLRSLMDGIVAVNDGTPENAPDWLTITGRINSAVPGFMYGVAGVSTNRWTPTPIE